MIPGKDFCFPLFHECCEVFTVALVNSFFFIRILLKSFPGKLPQQFVNLVASCTGPRDEGLIG